MLEVKPFSNRDKRFRELCARGGERDSAAEVEADTVLELVREGGGSALLDLVRRNHCPGLAAEALRVGPEELDSARDQVSEQFLTSLSLARVNLRKFHEYQRRRGYVHDDDGVILSRLTRPLGRIGICCGRSFSALLACAVPAQVAGVGAIALAVQPEPDGGVDARVLATARILGIEEIHRMDGAEAVAAFAYGAEPVAAVDKIVGPAGSRGEAAKRRVHGRVGVAPAFSFSELAVVADDSANARFIAADLLAQAEQDDGHGVLALFTNDRLLAEAVRIEIRRLAEGLGDPLIEAVLRRSCGLFVCRSLDEAVDAVNRLAPARLELITRDNEEYLADVENAGAVFLGPWSSEAAGDGFAGINPLLPAAGAARFASGLGVDDFGKEISVVEYGPDRLLKTGRHILTLTMEQGARGHAEAIRERLDLLNLAIE